MSRPGHARNRRTVLILGVVALAMLGLAYASVPLYTLFCQATGFGGATRRVATAPPHATDRTITVGLDANVNGDLPWDFIPETREVTLKLGETTIVNYRAHNRSDHAIVGTATHNVQPDRAGEYFDKIQCFCFTQQLLQPGETRTLPVQFFIDPALADDRKNDDVTHITLSYTFFLDKDQSLAHPGRQTSTAPARGDQ